MFEPEWDAERDADPYRWRRAWVGRQAGCQRLGASLFELPPGAASFPLHVHYANEELLIALAGSPTLEIPAGERQLDPGDVVAFPAGRRGAHRVRNGTRESCRIFVASTMRAPEITEFPESGELWMRNYPPGAEPPKDALDERRPAGAEDRRSSPLPSSSRREEAGTVEPVANVLDRAFDHGEAGSGGRARLGRQAGAQQLGLSLFELPAGFQRTAYHYHFANEELLIALAGRPSLRTPAGWRELATGEVAAFPAGERGAHRVINRGAEPARYLVLSEMNAPDVVVYPDSRKVLAISRPPGAPGAEDELAHRFRIDDAVDYWEGEPGPVEEDAAG